MQNDNRPKMSEEQMAKIYVTHIIPSAYNVLDYCVFDGPESENQPDKIRYEAKDGQFLTIGNSWIEVAEKIAGGWKI